MSKKFISLVNNKEVSDSNIKLSENDNTKEDVVVSEGNIDTPSLFEE